MRYLVFIIALFAAIQTNAQNNIVYGAGINYTNGAPTFTPPVRTSRVAIDTVTGKWYHFNTPGGWQLIGNTIEEIAGCTAPAYTPGKGDSKVVINNCSPQPELYFYNGSAWVLVGGGSVYAGEGIRIENDTIILDSLYVLRFRTGDTTDLNAGAVSWNAAEQTLDVVINQGAVTGQMFQEVLYFTKNQTGAQIDDGTVVMAAGTTGNSGKILIAPAIADGSVNSEYILGLATQNLPNGGEGMVTHFGKVRGIQTNGANFGETWVDGDVLYCSAVTPGYLTKVLPTAPNLKVPIAIVIHAHPSNGTLFVRPSHFPDLAQINDVQLSSPTNGQVLTYNSTLSRWENATPANQLQTLSTDNTPGNISISSGNTITLNVNDADASATNELQTLSVTANTATLSNSGGSVTIAGAGINTVGTAGTTITVTGTEVDGSTTNELQTLSTGTNTLTLSNGGGTVTVDTDPSTDVTGSGTSGQVSFWTGAQTQSGDNGLFWNNTDKRLGIGTNAPGAYPLEIFRSAAAESYGLNISTFNPGIRIEVKRTSGGAAFSMLECYATNTTTSQTSLIGLIGARGDILATPVPTYLYFGAATNTTLTENAFRIYPDKSVTIEGNTRIGSHTTPTSRLNITSSGSTTALTVNGPSTASSNFTALFQNSNSINTLAIRDDNKVGIRTSSPSHSLHVLGGSVNSAIATFSGGNNDRGLIIGTYLTGTNDAGVYYNAQLGDGEHDFRVNNLSLVRITSAGRLGIGLSAPAARLHVVGSGTSSSTWTAQFHNASTGGNNALMIRDDGNVGIGTSAPTQRLDVNGNIKLPNNTYIAFRNLANNNDIPVLQFNNSNILTIGTSSSSLPSQIGFFTNANERLRISNSGNIGIGTTTPNASAALDITSTTQGVLFPRMTTAQRDLIATPADGLVIYNTTDNKLQVRAAGAWVDLH